MYLPNYIFKPQKIGIQEDKCFPTTQIIHPTDSLGPNPESYKNCVDPIQTADQRLRDGGFHQKQVREEEVYRKGIYIVILIIFIV